MQAFDPAGDAALHADDAALVCLHTAGRVDSPPERAGFGRGGAHTEILRHARIDRHAGARYLVCILGRQLHVHEGRFARLVELHFRAHRVVPVQHSALGLDGGGLGCGVLGGGHDWLA
jgi:hypothetical protein